MVRRIDICVMDTFAFFLFLGLSRGQVSEPVKACPGDYRRRVETCIMEAQLAPQAGGGITLVFDKDTIVNLCDRGILRKTIDCLEEIHTRCQHNATVVQELDRLYSVDRWEQGAQLICQDTQLFQDNFDCLFRSANSVTSCVLMRTQAFRMGLAFADPADHALIRDVTCSFAESIVKCLCRPLEGECPNMELTKRVAGGMRLFLPPVCVSTFTTTPIPHRSSDGDDDKDHADDRTTTTTTTTTIITAVAEDNPLTTPPPPPQQSNTTTVLSSENKETELELEK
ncbi:hypothetical protein ACOMHN_017889 [Nucella lapillus]